MGNTNIKAVDTYPPFQRLDFCAGLSKHLPNDLFIFYSQFNLLGFATIKYRNKRLKLPPNVGTH